MPHVTERLDLRIGVAEKQRISEAAKEQGMTVAAFVRSAALREASKVSVEADAHQARGIAERMRGKATAGLTTEEILAFTRS